MGYAGVVEVLGPGAALMVGWVFCCLGATGIGLVVILGVLRAVGSIFAAHVMTQAMWLPVRLANPRRTGIIAIAVITLFEAGWFILFKRLTPLFPIGEPIASTVVIAAIAIATAATIGLITFYYFNRIPPAQSGYGFPIQPAHPSHQIRPDT